MYIHKYTKDEKAVNQDMKIFSKFTDLFTKDGKNVYKRDLKLRQVEIIIPR